jgi:erythromycin esterase-like protein
MWRNMDVLDFIDWLQRHNDKLPQDRRTGFYGLDLYSLHASIDSVLHFLEQVDPDAAVRARQRYSCFEQFGEDTQAYGYATSFGMAESCEREVVNQLVEMRRRAAELAKRDGKIDHEELFSAEQNARVVKNAETYYRTMFRGQVESWNIRDRHMADTLSQLIEHFGPQSKFVVWAHNSHIGDARATRMGRIGELNIGQLARQRYGDDAYLIGFTTHNGEVTAASEWGGVAERKRVRAALPGSIESEFHQVGIDNFVLPLRSAAVREELSRPRLERAIGVIYLPETERASHYFDAQVGEQFDAVIHIDRTRALIPLERTSEWEVGEPPETYPFAV